MTGHHIKTTYLLPMVPVWAVSASSPGSCHRSHAERDKYMVMRKILWSFSLVRNIYITCPRTRDGEILCIRHAYVQTRQTEPGLLQEPSDSATAGESCGEDLWSTLGYPPLGRHCNIFIHNNNLAFFFSAPAQDFVLVVIAWFTLSPICAAIMPIVTFRSFFTMRRLTTLCINRLW